MAVESTSRANALRIVSVLSAVAAFTFTATLYGQATSTPAQKPCADHCPAPAATPKSTAEQFPFPGEASRAAGEDAPGNGSQSSPASAPRSGSSAPPNSGGQFPYPGEAPAAGNSSSSSSSSSADADPDKPPPADDAERSPRRRLPKVKKLQSDEDREAEDITVARFYRDRGNWNAAYQRSKDAVKHQPDDPDAHLLLAETAQKLDKRDEAIAEYNALLKLDASEGQIKTARKALARLGSSDK